MGIKSESNHQITLFPIIYIFSLVIMSHPIRSINVILIFKLAFMKSTACWTVFSCFFFLGNSMYQCSISSQISFVINNLEALKFSHLFQTFFRSVLKFLFSFYLLSCSYTSNFSPINYIVLLTSVNASSLLV